MTPLPAEAQFYNLDQSGPTGFGGSGRAFGELELQEGTSGQPTRSFYWVGNIDDRCPGDGKGISFDIQAQFLDGGYNSIVVMEDFRTCEFSPRIYPRIQYQFGRVVDRARGILWYNTADTNVKEGVITYGDWKRLT